MTIQWINIRDDTNVIKELLMLKKDFKQITSNPGRGLLFCLWNRILYHNGKRKIIHAPKKIHIIRQMIFMQ